jgi:tetratricopeptide (TPR) repeat protein
MSYDVRGFAKTVIVICFFIWCASGIVFLCYAQNQNKTLDNAIEKYNQGDLEGALTEIKKVLQADPDNVEARKLQHKIQKQMTMQKSQDLTDLALIEIEKKNFDKAQVLLTQAIKIDSDNKRARELYLAIEEIKRVEGRKPDEEHAALGEEYGTEEGTRKKDEGGHENFYVQFSPLIAVSNSNAVSGIDSSVTHVGAKVTAVYYFNFFENRLGLSLDYSNCFLKFTGIDEINFILHRANISARFRIHLFKQDSFRTELGAKVSYHLYYLQNLETEGAYNFTLLYSPAVGIFFSDPVLARFIADDFLKNCGLEGEVNFLLIPGEENQAWLFDLEFYIGVYYKMESFRFSLGYSYYSIIRETLSETSHGIVAGVGYYF